MIEGVRAEASRARRRLILEAGLDCFLERGVGGTTVDYIRERCGASVGSFYHHFTSKVEVAAALYLETLDSYQRAFCEELRRHTTAQKGIEGTVRHHLRWVGQQPKLASYLSHCREPEVAAASEARAQELNGAFFADVLGWLQGNAELGEVTHLPAALYYALWMGPADEFTRLWLAGGQSRAHLADAEEVLPSAAWQALCGSPSGPPASANRRRRGRGRAD